MMRDPARRALIAVAALCGLTTTSAAQGPTSRLDQLKRESAADVERRAQFTQQMVDQIFSYGELGFQEVETSRYVTDILRRNGFRVDTNVAGIPTAWVATWGSGKPVISLGSDIDGIPQSTSKPGVACHDPIVPGAPGHGEGHNTGQPVIVTAALAVKRIMEREKLPGTIQIWPGVAEEQLSGKAFLVRAGVFKDVDVVMFTHVGTGFFTSWGQQQGSGLVSAEFTFAGQSAHAAGAPWRGRSALDAVELMNVGWNYRREHLRLQHRSHYIVKNGGDQPNVVPQSASVWYYFRETDYPRIRELFAIGDTIARAAAAMTGTTLSSVRILGSAWPIHMNRTIAEALHGNMLAVGMPRWSEADQALARATQQAVGTRPFGLGAEVDSLRGGMPPEANQGGPSDDIGDVSWTVPTATLYYPSNIGGLPGHHWSSSIASATPIAHKGATAGAKVVAATMLDFLLRPELVQQAWDYFRTVQTKDTKYEPLIRPEDRPPVELNRDIMARYRPEMRKYYYDPAKHRTYLEQLGIQYPTVKKADGSCGTATP